MKVALADAVFVTWAVTLCGVDVHTVLSLGASVVSSQVIEADVTRSSVMVRSSMVC